MYLACSWIPYISSKSLLITYSAGIASNSFEKIIFKYVYKYNYQKKNESCCDQTF